MLMKVVGGLILLSAAYAVYHSLWSRGFYCDGMACLIWFFLASLYMLGQRPPPNFRQIIHRTNRPISGE